MSAPFPSLRAAILFVLMVGGSVICSPVEAQDSTSVPPFDVRAHYEKREAMVAMRDGVKLDTVIYAPKDTSHAYPIMLVRTPYSAGPYGQGEYRPPEKMAPSDDFLRDGYIFVFQDVRGTHNSEGEWVSLRPIRSEGTLVDESTDAYDTIDWLVKHVRGNNGRVGQWGISYPGWYTVMSLIGAHPALKAVSPQATTFDAFIGDDDHRNGGFDLTGAEWWYRMSLVTGPTHRLQENSPIPPFNFGDPWSYQFFLDAGPTNELSERAFGGGLRPIWHDLMDHPDYDDYWQSRNVGPHLTNVRIAVLSVMGWFDAYDPYGAMATYHAIEERNPKNLSTIVAGPWGHSGWRNTDGSKDGDIQFGAKTSEYYQRHIIFPFFQHYLKDERTPLPAEAIMFETGGNRWREFDQWPPKTVTHENLYLHPNGSLGWGPPVEPEAFDSYVSDPSHPVPYTPLIASGADDQTFMTADQRFTYSRPDVLSYQTEPLRSDVTIAGPIPVDLYVSTTGTDSDWVVKLIDVYPPDTDRIPHDPATSPMGNYQMLLGTNVLRGKYRHSFSTPTAMVPEAITSIHFEIRDKFHTFLKGHRIMVQVQSSWFPRIDRNPQVFTNIYLAKPQDYRKATQQIFRSERFPSRLELPVLPSTNEPTGTH